MEIKNMPIIDCHDIETELGIHWSGFEFTQMVENGSYIEVACDDDEIEEILEDIKWELGKESMTMEDIENGMVKSSTNRYLKRLVNQYHFMKYLREEHKLTSVLVNVYW